MKTNVSLTLLSCFATLPLVACGGDEPQEVPDARRRADAMPTPPDAMQQAACVPPVNVETVQLEATRINRTNGSYSVGWGVRFGPAPPAPPAAVVFLRFWPGFTPYGTEALPTDVVVGPVTMDATQHSEADCGACLVLIDTPVIVGGQIDSGNYYTPISGTINVTSVGATEGTTLTAELQNLTLKQIIPSGQNTPQMDHPSNCMTTMTGTFTGNVVVPPAALAADPSLVQQFVPAKR